jgi:hypothetical protein
MISSLVVSPFLVWLNWLKFKLSWKGIREFEGSFEQDEVKYTYLCALIIQIFKETIILVLAIHMLFKNMLFLEITLILKN